MRARIYAHVHACQSQLWMQIYIGTIRHRYLWSCVGEGAVNVGRGVYLHHGVARPLRRLERHGHAARR